MDLVHAGPRAGTLIDYGCGAGSWSLVASERFEQVFALDVQPKSLARARELMALNDVDNVEIIDASQSRPQLPKADAMIAIDVMTVIRSDHAHEMFAFARDHLAEGGYFLLSSRRVASMIDQMLSLERFKYDGVLYGLRRYAAVTRSALETYYSPRIRDIPRARPYHHVNAVPRLGAEYGFGVVRGPDDLARLEAFQELDWFYKGHRKARRWFRWCDWHLLRKAGGA